MTARGVCAGAIIAVQPSTEEQQIPVRGRCHARQFVNAAGAQHCQRLQPTRSQVTQFRTHGVHRDHNAARSHVSRRFHDTFVVDTQQIDAGHRPEQLAVR